MRLSRITKTCLLIIFFLATRLNSAIAQDISGFWQGVFYQPSGGPSTYYPASMELKQVGTDVTGVETTQLPNGSPAFIKINLKGTFINDTLRYTVSGIITQVSPGGLYYWCTYSVGVLAYDAANEKLKGITDAVGCAGPGSAEFWRLRVLSDTVFCEGGKVDLRVSGNDVKWFSNFPATNQINRGNTYAPTITSSTTYYLTQTHYNTQSPAIAVRVTIKPRTYGVINQTICDGQSFMGHRAAGKYVDTLVSSSGCDSIRTVNLTVTPKPVVQMSRTICAGQSFNGHNVQGNYFDTIRSVSGCDTVINLNLKVVNNAAVNLGPDLGICAGDTLVLKAPDYVSYVWEDGSTGNSHTVKKAGLYTVTATNACGMSSSDNILVTEQNCIINFPNAFTPNGDGNNDVFKMISNARVTNFHLAVYNRWGQKVFESSDPSVGWNGKDGIQGQYVWHCNFDRMGITQKHKGVVHLLR